MPVPDVTVLIAVTDRPKWGKAAAACAFTLAVHSRPAEVRIVAYKGGGAGSRVSRKYDAIQAPFRTKWVLHLDADSVFAAPLEPMIEEADAMNVKVGARHAPDQLAARKHWNEGNYKMLWQRSGMPYCKMATTCAVLMRSDYAEKVFPRVEHWRNRIDATGMRLQRIYHHAQAAFTMACGEQGIREKDFWWLDRRQLSWPTEEPGIIVHGGRTQFKAILAKHFKPEGFGKGFR